MSTIETHCKHCHQEITSTTAVDPFQWAHEATDESPCDTEGVPAGSLATPDAEKLLADAIAALDPSITLNYVSYDDKLDAAQIQVLLDGENPWESKEFTNFETWESEAGYHGVQWVLDDLLTEEQREILEAATTSNPGYTMKDGQRVAMTYTTDLMEDLRSEIQDRDDIDPAVGDLEGVYRYDLDVSIDGGPWDWDNDTRRETYREIATAAGLNVLDRDVIRKLRELTENASYGGHLYVIWYTDAETAIELAEPTHWKDTDKGPVEDTDVNGTVTFTGSPSLIILDHWNGSGHEVTIDTITVPWKPRNVSIDAKGTGRGYSWDEIAGVYGPAYDATATVTLDRQPPTKES